MRHALQGSLNIPAIKTAIRTGADQIWRDMRDGVFKFLGEDNYAGASIAIGTLEARYVDLLSAYGALASQGDTVPRRYVLSIEDRNGDVIWKAASPSSERRSVMEPAVADLVTNIIAANTDPSQNPVWASRRLIAANGKRRPATFKTGTTDQAKDLAAFGYLAPPTNPDEQHLITGVWTGNSDATPATVLSLSAAGGLWQSYFTEISRNLPIAQFKDPEGLEQVVIDANTGELPGPCTISTISEYFLPGTAPTTSCSSFRTLAVDQASGLLWDSSCTGARIQKVFMDLSLLETEWPTWQAANIEWAERARQGLNIVGGARLGKTAYFYESYWRPNGNTWGGEIGPTRSCSSPAPTPAPIP
jgi:membrane peptidoglycan carboxypeptidase